MDPEEVKKLIYKTDEPLMKSDLRPNMELYNTGGEETKAHVDSVNTNPYGRVYDTEDIYLEDRNWLEKFTDLILGTDSRTVETKFHLRERPQLHLFENLEGAHQMTKFFETGGEPILGTYSDANQPSTGFGHRIIGADSLGVSKYGPTFIPRKYGKFRENQDKNDKWFRDITPEEAETFFVDDYREKSEKARNMLLPGKFDLLPINAQAALVDMVYNMGENKLTDRFERMISALNEGNVDLAAENIMYVNADRPNEKNYKVLSDYYSEGGDRPKYIMELMRGTISIEEVLEYYNQGLSRYR